MSVLSSYLPGILIHICIKVIYLPTPLNSVQYTTNWSHRPMNNYRLIFSLCASSFYTLFNSNLQPQPWTATPDPLSSTNANIINPPNTKHQTGLLSKHLKSQINSEKYSKEFIPSYHEKKYQVDYKSHLFNMLAKIFSLKAGASLLALASSLGAVLAGPVVGRQTTEVSLRKMNWIELNWIQTVNI